MPMTKKQKIVGAGAASGILIMIASVAIIARHWPVGSGTPDMSTRLAYVLQINAIAVLPLLLGIVTVGNNRFASDAIDPTAHKEGRRIEINSRVLDNTLQQSLLFVIGTMALSTTLTGPQMGILPAAACVFVGARIAFWIGYRIDPLYRAFGMAATIYLNLGIIVAAIWRAFYSS